MRAYKEHLNNKFEFCRRIGEAEDLHRHRHVTLFYIPGDYEYVGVFDTVDAWIAPVSANPFSLNIARIMEDIKNGKEPTYQPTIRRRSITADHAAPAADPEPVLRRRPIATAQPAALQRRVIRA